jgi:hypothetical protein
MTAMRIWPGYWSWRGALTTHPMRNLLRHCYGCRYPFVTGLFRGQTSISLPIYRCVTSVTAPVGLQWGGRGYISTGEVIQDLTRGSRDNRGFDFLLRGLCLLLLNLSDNPIPLAKHSDCCGSPTRLIFPRVPRAEIGISRFGKL